MSAQELIDAIVNDKYRNIKALAIEKFGEENIDFQLPDNIDLSTISTIADYYSDVRYDPSFNNVILYLIIYFPKKTVTCNETGNTHDIEEVYCRMGLLEDGSFNISTARAKYTSAEIYSSYTHSHVSGVSSSSRVFNTTCLGRDNTPLNRLRNAPHRDDVDWIQIFNEIDRFYEVESLRGVPYRRLDDISKYDIRHVIQNYYSGSVNGLYKYDTDFSDFVYFVSDKIKKDKSMISVADGELYLNCSAYDFKVFLTNCIVEYLNSLEGDTFKEEKKKFKKVMEKNIKTRTGIYTSVGRGMHLSYDDMFLFKFKGRDVYRKVVSDDTEEDIALMPKARFQTYVYIKILIMLNYERCRCTTNTVKIIL